MTRTLAPIYDRAEYSAPAAREMVRQLYELIFRPVFDILNIKAPRINSQADIRNALRAGRVFWQEGYFYGQFNSVVGRSLRALGAKFVPSKRAYKLDLADIPMDMRTDLVIGKGLNRSKTERILKHLDDVSQAKITLGPDDHGDVIMDDLGIQVIKTFKVLPESIQLPYDLTDKQKQDMQEKYNTNMEMFINGWKDEQIERLREKTEANAVLGYRADRLAKIVKNEFSVTEKRARFIARQETSIFVSKYRQLRYEAAGSKDYIWSTSHDERVRHDPRGGDHRVLDGRRFSWDSPPVVDHATGRTANPGEDFGCRCLALPVINIRGS